MSRAARMKELETKDTPRTPNRRRGPNRLLLSLQGAVILVIAVILAISLFFLNQTRRDLGGIREDLETLRRERGDSPHAAPGSPANAGPSAEDLREWIATLRSEIADGRSSTTKAVSDARAEATGDRTALRVTLAQILGRRGATSDEIAALLAPLSPDERRKFLAELDVAEPGEQENGSGETAPAPGSGESPAAPRPSPGDSRPMDGGGSPETPETDPLPENLPSPAETTPPTPPVESSPPPETPPTGTSEEEPAPPGTSPTEPDEDKPDEPDEEVVIYTVRRGDTISAIALKFKVSEKALLEANKITNPRAIQIAQKLVIPGVRR